MGDHLKRVHLGWSLENPTCVSRKLQAMSGSMVNTYTKGNRVEKKCRELFEKEGWLTWKPSRAKYNSNDAFGLFDCILIRGGEVAFMQVKSNPSHFYAARKEIADWHDKNKLMVTVIVSLYQGNNVWRIEWYDWSYERWTKYPLTIA